MPTLARRPEVEADANTARPKMSGLAARPKMSGLAPIKVDLGPMQNKKNLLKQKQAQSIARGHPSPRVQEVLAAAARRRAKKQKGKAKEEKGGEAKQTLNNSQRSAILSPKVVEVLRQAATRTETKPDKRASKTPTGSGLTLAALSRQREKGARQPALARWLQKTISPAKATEEKRKEKSARRSKKKKETKDPNDLPALSFRPKSAVAGLDREPGGTRSSLPSLNTRTSTAPANVRANDRVRHNGVPSVSQRRLPELGLRAPVESTSKKESKLRGNRLPSLKL